MGLHRYASLLPPSWKATVQTWLDEDIPGFDCGGFVVGDRLESATLYCKSPGVVAGCPFFDEIFRQLECSVKWLYTEGDFIDPTSLGVTKVEVARVTGPARNILLAERTGLNLLARASGIATRAKAASDIAKQGPYEGRVAGTRKTTPGFRLVEKYAMTVGGVDTHRMNLSSMVMLKDNHIWSRGSIPDALRSAREVAGFSLKIEVEARDEKEAREAIEHGADVVMLDNFSPRDLRPAAARLRKDFPHVTLEASGGITMENLREYINADVDVLSMGALTQGVDFVDFSLKIDRK